MKFRGDDRAVVIQIGAVLLLAAVVVAMTGYQATVVPDQNGEIEFDHNQQVQSQLQELRNGIVSTPGGGSGGSHTVSLGTSYPARTLFVNPAPASGQLRTAESGAVRIENASVASGEPEALGIFWGGDDQSWNTSRLEYRPGYSEYDGAPTSVYEHTRLYNRHPRGGATLITGQRIVQDGDTITIVALRGDLQESSSGSVSVDARALSSSSNAVPIESDGTGNVTITLPTKNPDYWNDTVREADGVHDVSVGGGNVTIELEARTYDLRMAAVGIGDVDPERPADRAAYVVPVDDSAPTVVAEIRDEFNNPVSGVEYQVDGAVSDAGTTGPDGKIEIRDVDAGETVTVSVIGSDVEEGFTVGAGTDGGGGGSSAYGLDWNDPSSISSNGGLELTDCSAERCTWDVGASSDSSLALRAATSPTVEELNTEFRVSDSGVGSLSDSDPDTGTSGEATTTLNAHADGTVKVYTISGGSSDVIDLTVQNVSGDGSPLEDTEPPVINEFTVSDQSGAVGGSGKYNAEYEVTNRVTDRNLDTVTIELIHSSGDVVDTATGANRTVSLSDGTQCGQDRSCDYTVRITASDQFDRTTQREITDTADGSGGSSAGQFTFSGGLAETQGSTNAARITATNGGSSAAVVDTIVVASTSTTATAVFEEGTGSDSPGQHEIYVDAQDAGYLDMSGPPSYEENRNQLVIGQVTPLNRSATVPSGTDATISVFEFVGSNGNAVSMAGETVTIRIGYEDGSVETTTFTASNPY